MQKPISYLFATITLFMLGCTKHEPWRPFISCKIDGGHWETEYSKTEDIKYGVSELPRASGSLLQPGTWTFYGVKRDSKGNIDSDMSISFKVSGTGFTSDSIHAIEYHPSFSNREYKGNFQSCTGSISFGSGGSSPKGTFSGQIIRPASPQRPADTMTITDGVLEAR